MSDLSSRDKTRLALIKKAVKGSDSRLKVGDVATAFKEEGGTKVVDLIDQSDDLKTVTSHGLVLIEEAE